MKALRARLTYANVVATIALFFALTGGAVYAARKIHSRNIARNAVKSRNLAKNAVKVRNLAPNSVNSSKIADGSIAPADFAPGAGAAVLGSFEGGSVPVTDGSLNAAYPLNPSGNFSLDTGAAALIAADVQATIAWDSSIGGCQASATLLLDGTVAGSIPFSNPNTSLQTQRSSQVLGLVTSPGNHQITAVRNGFSCTSDSRFDFIHARVLGIG